MTATDHTPDNDGWVHHLTERWSEAVHGGRYITGALARGLDSYPHLRAVLADCASPDFPYQTPSDAWAYYLSPSGDTGSGRGTTASLARKAADGQDVFGNRPTYRRTLTEAEAMMDWPIYRAAMGPTIPPGDGTLGPSEDVSRRVKDHLNDIADGYPFEVDEWLGERWPGLDR